MAESPRIVELQQKFEENPRRYFASLANEYRKAGELQRAISICRIYLDKQPAHMAGHVVLGQSLFSSGKLEEAAEVFETVLGLDPENLLAHRSLGDIAQSNAEFGVAQDHFKKVLAADPRDHDISSRLKTVEESLKAASVGGVRDWIPPRTDEFPLSEAVHDAAPQTPVIEDAAKVEPLEASEQSDPELGDSLGIFDVEGPGGRDLPPAAPEDSPHQSLEVENLPGLEAPAVHEDVAEDDFVDTLLPNSETEHQPAIAEPVTLESAEETLAVPDLMAEADVPYAPSAISEGDDFQYRTAEFSLPNSAASKSDASSASTEMESEAEALMDEAEIPPASALDDYTPQVGNPMRTGEYSLSLDTEGWNGESIEPAAESAEDETPGEMAGMQAAGPFITETVAELYLQQGFTGEALLVYRQLARAKPGDERIAARIATLEQRLAEEHTLRQAALDTTQVPDAPSEPESPAPPAPEPSDDWFSSPDVPAARARQTVQEFFAVLGRARPEIRSRRERIRVSAADISAAADITAGFGAFGMEPRPAVPQPIAPQPRGESDPQGDVRRFRSWLDGLSDS